jgi:methylase of polypeptide subunit release factors
MLLSRSGLKMLSKRIEDILKGKKLSKIDELDIVTDMPQYQGCEQVFPLHPENQYYLDEIIEEKIKGADVLEIGLGSGVLSIGAVKKGAKKVTALEINPRAKNYAGFNILVNNVEDFIEIRDGNEKEVFKPVEGMKFNYIISNPPFEPTSPNIKYYLHSSGGIYGLDFVEKIFKDLDKHLRDNGHAQIVSFAPGNEKEPFMLVALVKKYLNGQTTIKVNPISMRFDDFVDRFIEIGQATEEQVSEMKKQATQNGITHLYLCMVHYEKGENSLKIEPSKRVYEKWDLPLGSDVPMGYKIPK